MHKTHTEGTFLQFMRWFQHKFAVRTFQLRDMIINFVFIADAVLKNGANMQKNLVKIM